MVSNDVLHLAVFAWSQAGTLVTCNQVCIFFKYQSRKSLCIWIIINFLMVEVVQIKTFFLSLKIYGAAVSFFEVLPEEQLTEERKKALQLNDERVREFDD